MSKKLICLFILLVLSVAGNTSADLVAHWLFDESSGSVAHDASGNGNNGNINGAFMDWTVRKIGLKELWALNWYRGFNMANAWTKAGGVMPEDWPQWMRTFKDY